MLHLGVARHLLDREEHEGDVGDEGLDAADADGRTANRDVRHLSSAVPEDHANRKGADDLDGGQEERGQPRRAIARPVHFARQPLELFQVFMLAA